MESMGNSHGFQYLGYQMDFNQISVKDYISYQIPLHTELWVAECPLNSERGEVDK